MPPTDERRARARRRAWGRGPMIFRFESLEGRQLLAAATLAPDLTGVTFDTGHNLDWGDSFHAKGSVQNQGTAATASAVRVAIYASPTPAIGLNSVLLGSATIPSGVQPGQTVSFDQTVNLPANALAGVDGAGHVYVGTLIDPDGALTESTTANNSGSGQGYDTSVVTITPHLPSALGGVSLGVSPDQTQWGSTVQVTAQIKNEGAGDSPATRARVVLTPAGTAPGGDADVTVGSLSVPVIQPYQTATVSQAIALPSVPPTSLGTAGQYTLSVVNDADFAINPLSPHVASRGLGFDMTQVAIATPTNTVLNAGTRPDLVATSIAAPSLPIAWGQSFQATAKIQNDGKLDSGPFTARFLLVGPDGSLNNALFLGDVTLDGIKAGYGQSVVQTLKLPTKLPSGVTLNSAGLGRIAVVVNPENTLDELTVSNNAAVSGNVSLKVVGTDGVSTPATTVTPTPTATAATPTATKAHPHMTLAQQKRAYAKAVADAKAKAAHPLQHNLKVFPKRVESYFKGLFK